MSYCALYGNLYPIGFQWDAENEKWYFSVIDVIEILTESPRPRKYWNALKTKLILEGSELSKKMVQLKMQSADGKFYLTDVADTEQLFLLIQSIPSPKAEPFKQWKKLFIPAQIRTLPNRFYFKLSVRCNFERSSLFKRFPFGFAG